MLDDYNKLQDKIAESYSKEITIMKRKFDDQEKSGTDSDQTDKNESDKKIKTGDQTETKNIICMHAKFHK